jgi:hypothetical protein
VTTGNLTRVERQQFSVDAWAFIAGSSEALGICDQLRAELVNSQFLHEFAFQDDAERFIARQEAWAAAIGAQVAETVRAAFRATEADVRRSMQRAQEAAWQKASEGEFAHFCAVFGDPPHVSANGKTT